MPKRSHIVAVALLLAVVAAVVGLFASGPGSDAPPDSEVVRAPVTTPPPAQPEPAVAETWLEPALEDGGFSARLDGVVRECDFVVGAPGVYPPVDRAASRGVALPEPAAPLSGEPAGTVEVLARCDGHAFWGEVERSSDGVELGPAAPLSVTVVDDAGAPVPNASVYLGRAAIGLVRLRGQTDPAGAASFPDLPTGSYVATVRAPGRRVAVAELDRDGAHVIVALRGREVVGRVTGEGGVAVAGATVAIHANDAATDPFDDVPVDVVSTDARGEFRAGPVTSARVAAVASADGWAPGNVVVDDPTAEWGEVRVDIELARGRALRAWVVDESERPVAQAKVEWRDASGRAGATALSDETGVVRFSGVPPSAVVGARLGSFEARPVDLSALPGADFDIKLVLKNADARLWRVRLVPAPDVEIRTIEAHDTAGARCALTTSDQRDFVLSACGDGELWFTAQTDRGTVRWSAGRFSDGIEVAMPLPVTVAVDVRGASDEPWAATSFQIAGANAVNLSLDVEPRTDNRRVTTRAYPGKWRLVAANPRIGSQIFELLVDDDGLDERIELAALHLFKVFVVDGYGAPVTGAYAMLFAGDELIDVKRSSGQLPLEFRVRPPFDGSLLVVDPRRGEARVRLDSAGKEGEHRVALREKVLTTPTPSSRLPRAELAELLGAELVAQDNGWALDLHPGGAGERAGLIRSDLVVSAWRSGRTVRVVAFRRGTGYVDVVVR